MICAPAEARPVSEREHGPEDREHREDGAYIITNSESVRESGPRTVSPRHSRIAPRERFRLAAAFSLH